MDKPENKGLWTRASAWIKRLFKREAQPRKRGRLRKNSVSLMGRAKAAAKRGGDRCVALGRQIGRGMEGLARRAWPRVQALFRRTAELLEPLLQIVAIMAMAVTGGILVTNVGVFMAGFVGEATAAAVTFIAAYLGLVQLSAALRGDRDDPEEGRELSAAEPDTALEQYSDVLAGLRETPEFG